MHKTLLIFALFVFGGTVSNGQISVSPRIHLEATDFLMSDNVNDRFLSTPVAYQRVTNFNPSRNLRDSIMTFVYDSLRTDGMATIVTVYETDSDSTVGLWQIGSGSNRTLWLNSRRVSYDDFSITYRDATEQGVIIHTMLYQYPRIQSTYDGYDTLYIGCEGRETGDKNFCALMYFPGKLDYRYQRWLESALAIRYGALLHGPYVNSLSDTLWNPLGADSLYSYGICGIGRDDSLSLMQPKSMIRNGHLSIESSNSLKNLAYVMIGHDGGDLDFGGDIIVIDTVQYAAINRHWKIRAHDYESVGQIRIVADLPLPHNAVRLMLTNGSETTLYSATGNDSIIFDSITIRNGQDYILALLVNPTALPYRTKRGEDRWKKDVDGEQLANDSDFRITVHPNPTVGRYIAEIDQIEGDIVSLQVMDAAGRIVEKHVTEESLTQYKHSGLLSATGVYYVTVSSNGKQKTIKLIVAK